MKTISHLEINRNPHAKNFLIVAETIGKNRSGQSPVGMTQFQKICDPRISGLTEKTRRAISEHIIKTRRQELHHRWGIPNEILRVTSDDHDEERASQAVCRAFCSKDKRKRRSIFPEHHKIKAQFKIYFNQAVRVSSIIRRSYPKKHILYRLAEKIGRYRACPFRALRWDLEAIACQELHDHPIAKKLYHLNYQPGFKASELLAGLPENTETSFKKFQKMKGIQIKKGRLPGLKPLELFCIILFFEHISLKLTKLGIDIAKEYPGHKTAIGHTLDTVEMLQQLRTALLIESEIALLDYMETTIQ